MLNFFIRLVLMSATIFPTNIVETTGDENFPLVLIKLPTKLVTPIGLISKKTITLQQQESYYFKYGLRYFNEDVFFCPAEKHKQMDEIKKSNKLLSQQTPPQKKISENCLFEHMRTTSGYLFGTMEHCNEKVQPVMQKYLKRKDGESEELEHVSCGSDGKNGEKYFYGYQICIDYKINETPEKIPQKLENMPEGFPFKDVIDFDVYQFCYDNENKDTMHTKHQIRSPQLLDNPTLLERRSQRYDMISLGYGLFDENFGNFKQKIKKIENLHRDKQTPYKPQRFTPPEDFAFALWTKLSYHYVNTGLIHGELSPIWEHIEEIIRNHAKKAPFTSEYHVYTGAFKLSPPDSRQVHKIEGLQVPEIWVKLLHHVYHDEADYSPTIIKSAVAIVANNYLSEAVDSHIERELCAINLCPEFGKQNFPKFAQYIRCCRASVNLQKLFAVSLEYSRPLRIDGFLEVADDYSLPMYQSNESVSK